MKNSPDPVSIYWNWVESIGSWIGYENTESHFVLRMVGTFVVDNSLLFIAKNKQFFLIIFHNMHLFYIRIDLREKVISDDIV